MKVLINLGLLSALILLSIQALSQQAETGVMRTNEQQFAETKHLFKEKCARCHGDDGRGNTTLGEILDPPDFTDKNWWQGDVQDQRLMSSIRNGKGDMPKFEKKLTDQQIESLIKYVRQFDKSAEENGNEKPKGVATLIQPFQF
jgi:mono/diheme cytochrome c family protein